jgi:hypothetical protein
MIERRAQTLSETSLGWHYETQRTRSVYHAIDSLTETLVDIDPVLVESTRYAAAMLVQAYGALVHAQTRIDAATNAAEAALDR